jgi:hypothetical protein
MYCEETSGQESAVLEILSENTVNFKLEGSLLTLTAADGGKMVMLARK